MELKNEHGGFSEEFKNKTNEILKMFVGLTYKETELVIRQIVSNLDKTKEEAIFKVYYNL